MIIYIYWAPLPVLLCLFVRPLSLCGEVPFRSQQRWTGGALHVKHGWVGLGLYFCLENWIELTQFWVRKLFLALKLEWPAAGHVADWEPSDFLAHTGLAWPAQDFHLQVTWWEQNGGCLDDFLFGPWGKWSTHMSWYALMYYTYYTSNNAGETMSSTNHLFMVYNGLYHPFS